jgi:hypothetical protein
MDSKWQNPNPRSIVISLFKSYLLLVGRQVVAVMLRERMYEYILWYGRSMSSGPRRARMTGNYSAVMLYTHSERHGTRCKLDQDRHRESLIPN